MRRTSFGATADVYSATRPDWPTATAFWLTGGSPSLDVLDLGAGTGKLTLALLAAGHRVVAVDPSERMLEQLRLVAPCADARVGSAERLPLGDAAVDVVAVAQAWHWFDAERAAVQCRRVLRPGGLLSLGWHARDERVPWVAELSALAGLPPHPAAGQQEEDVEPLVLPPGFGPVETRVFAYRQRTTPDGLAALASTWSYVAVSPRREVILDGVRSLGARVAESDGTLVLPQRTWCYRARRLPD